MKKNKNKKLYSPLNPNTGVKATLNSLYLKSFRYVEEEECAQLSLYVLFTASRKKDRGGSAAGWRRGL